MRQKSFDKFKAQFYNKFPNSDYLFYNTSKRINHIIVLKQNDFIDCRARRILAGAVPTHSNNNIKEQIELNNNNSFKIIDMNRGELKIKNKYGICIISTKNIGYKYQVCVKSAINKTDYYINWLKDKCGNLYDLSLVNYINSKTPIKIICKTHGIIEIIPKYLNRGRVCNLCSKNNLSNNPFKHTTWFEMASKSKYYESFKVYIVKCCNENEEFYKIGKTYLPIKMRLKQIPYNYEIIKIFTKNKLDERDSKIISKLEAALKKKNKNFKYTPLIKFGGDTECYKQLI